MSYEERLQAMIEKGAINNEQARQFSESLERLTPAVSAPVAIRKPISMLHLSLSVLGLLLMGMVAVSIALQPQSDAAESIQHVASAINQPGTTGAMAQSATTLLSMFILFALPLIAVLFFLAGVYNRLVGYDETIKRTGAYIQNALTNKRELIPQLQATAESALRYEETLQHSIAETRSSAAATLQQGIQDIASVPEKPLAGLLHAALEAYPQLKAQESLQYLQQELSRLEHNLLIARNIHAEAIADYSTASRSVFGSVVAGMYGFKPQFQSN